MARIKGVYKKRDGAKYCPSLEGEERWLDAATGRVYSTATCEESCGTLRLQTNGEWVLYSGLMWVPVKPTLVRGVYAARTALNFVSDMIGWERWLDTTTGAVYSSASGEYLKGGLCQEDGEWVLNSDIKWVPWQAPVSASVPAALAPEHEYVVFVQGGQSPTKRHKSFTDAETEAKRLCEKEKTKTVLVLRVEAEVKCVFTAQVHVL